LCDDPAFFTGDDGEAAIEFWRMTVQALCASTARRQALRGRGGEASFRRGLACAGRVLSAVSNRRSAATDVCLETDLSGKIDPRRIRTLVIQRSSIC